MPRNQRNKYLRFINVAFEMAICIGGGVFLGIWLDTKFPNNFSGFTIFCSLFGVFLALYLVIKRVKDLTKDEK